MFTRFRRLPQALCTCMCVLVLWGMFAGAVRADTQVMDPIPTPNSGAFAVTVGPDGNSLWTTERTANKLARVAISDTGPFTEFPLPTAHAQPGYIISGPDHALWFTETGANQIGRKAVPGAITEFSLGGLLGLSQPLGITSCGGALWFTAQGLLGLSGQIGRITTAGVVTAFMIPPLLGLLDQPHEITCSTDGALWFTDPGTNRIGRLTTAGVFTMFAVPTPHAGVNGIASAPDNSIWFTEKGAGKIGVVTSLGQLTEYAARSGDTPVDITSCPSGISSSIYGVVVTADNSSSGAVLDIGRVDNGTFTSERDDTVFSNDPASTAYGTTCRPSTSQATRLYRGSHDIPGFSDIDASISADHSIDVESEFIGF